MTLDTGAGSAPASLVRAGSGGLLERDGELDRLRESLSCAVGGRGGSVAVVGPAGIGKTSLLEAARDLAAEPGVAWLEARGGELERDFAYGIVRQLFERPLHGLPARERRAALAGAAALAASVVGVEADAEATADDSPFAVLHGLYWLCGNLARRRPIVLVVDDLHWADAASLRFLAYLQPRLAELPLLLLVASRPPESTAHRELVEHVLSQPATATIRPAPLTEQALARLVRTITGGPPEPAFVRACHEATAGNPFLCAVLVAALAEQGELAVPGDGAAVLDLATGALAVLVVRRLGRLPAAASALVDAVAVLGGDAELRHAAALAGIDPEAAAAAVDALVAQDILRKGGALEFTHPLVRAAVRDRLPGGERALLHERAAGLLEREGAEPERIAMHVLAAEPAAAERAVDVLRLAARRVIARGDPGTATTFLQRALREPPRPGMRTTVLHELGVAELHAGEAEPAAEHLGQALELADEPLARAPVARDLCLALTTTGRYQTAAELLLRALGELAGAERDLALQLEAELHQSAMMDPSLYALVRDRLDQLDPDVSGDSRGERAVLAALATEGCLRILPAAQVRAWATRAFARGLLDDQTPYSSLWGNAAFPLVFADGFGEADDVVAQAIADARRRGSPIASARAHAVGSMLAFRRGAVRDAESDARASTELGLQAGFSVSLLPLGVLVEALVERGELEAAETTLAGAGRAGAIPERFLESWVLHARGRLRLAQGRLGEAVADLDLLGRRGERGWRPWNPGLYPYRSHLALALLGLGERARARAVAEEELVLSRRWASARALGISLRTLGLVEAGPDGVALLRESVATLERSGAELEHARSLLELGAAVRRSGKRTDAREPLGTAMELAHRCGATALARQAREELVAAGSRPRRMVRSGVDALTASELRVARLAADGMSNREVAQTLFVTLRTVQLHLTNTYRKLAIRSRKELPAALESPAAPPRPDGIR